MYSHHSENGTNTATKPKFKLNDVLVEVGGWRLVRPLYPGMLGVDSYIVHMECQPARVGKTVQDMGAGVRKVCVKCGETPPAEIAGLEILHNGKI